MAPFKGPSNEMVRAVNRKEFILIIQNHKSFLKSLKTLRRPRSGHSYDKTPVYLVSQSLFEATNHFTLIIFDEGLPVGALPPPVGPSAAAGGGVPASGGTWEGEAQ